MKNTIEETTRLLLQGTLTKDEADKILLDLHGVVRGAISSHCLSLNDECSFTQTCPECTKPATEPLPAEGVEKGGSGCPKCGGQDVTTRYDVEQCFDCGWPT